MSKLVALIRSLVRRRRPSAERPRWHSVSSTRAYEMCPRHYRFAYVDRIPEPRGKAPEAWRFGTVVHRGLEVGYRHHHEVGYSRNLRHSIPLALEAVRECWVAEQMPDDPDGLDRAERVVARSLATTRLRPRDIIGVERFFRTETPEGLRVAGATDLVLRAGRDAVEIRDHKVTRYVRTPDQLAGDFQLGLYGWLVRQTWPWAKRVTVSHHYPLTREVVRVELDDAWIESSIARLRAAALRAEADREFTPTPGEHCVTCVYSDRCPARADAAPAVASVA